MLLSKRTIPKLLVLLFASAIVFSGCEDLFGDKPDPEEEIDPNAPVYIPDYIFLDALIEQGVDTNGDSLISYAEAEEVNYLNIRRAGIYCDSLVGLEAFVNLDTFICSYGNDINSLDFSNNLELKYLDCATCGLKNLDVTKNSALSYLDVNGVTLKEGHYSNNLTNLDVSNCTSLTYLDCNNNDLTSLDVSNCTALKELRCFTNKQLTSLDVSNNTALTYLSCRYNNQLNSLDVSGCTALEILDCTDNKLTSLDVSSCTALTKLYCGRWNYEGNNLTNLDVSKNTALTYLNCGSNNLSSLDVTNNTSLETLDIGDMPTLTQVCVWTMPFPPDGVEVDTDGSPNVYFTTDCSE